MNTDPDEPLRQSFQAQRQAEHTHAPTWRPQALRAPVRLAPPAHDRFVWLALSAATLIALGSFIALTPQTPEPRLSEALPVLLDAPAEPLFASLEFTSTTPSDLLLPPHLTIQMP